MFTVDIYTDPRGYINIHHIAIFHSLSHANSIFKMGFIQII